MLGYCKTLPSFHRVLESYYFIFIFILFVQKYIQYNPEKNRDSSFLDIICDYRVYICLGSP